MFSNSAALGSNKMWFGVSPLGAGNGSGERFGASVSATPADRLAELVHHLGAVPMAEAHRAIRRSGHEFGEDDPLSLVAGALVQLRRDSLRCVAV